MAVNYSNLANNPELYVDISNLAKEPHHAAFNLADLSRIQYEAGTAGEPVVEDEPQDEESSD